MREGYPQKCVHETEGVKGWIDAMNPRKKFKMPRKRNVFGFMCVD